MAMLDQAKRRSSGDGPVWSSAPDIHEEKRNQPFKGKRNT
jgi:hypothetical protein